MNQARMAVPAAAKTMPIAARPGAAPAGRAPAVPPAGAARDFDSEVADLVREFPEAVRGGAMPEEVVRAAVLEGKSLLEAYRDYALATQGQESVALWNSRNRSRAPVRGVSGGAPVMGQARDLFLTGFEG